MENDLSVMILPRDYAFSALGALLAAAALAGIPDEA